MKKVKVKQIFSSLELFQFGFRRAFHSNNFSRENFYTRSLTGSFHLKEKRCSCILQGKGYYGSKVCDLALGKTLRSAFTDLLFYLLKRDNREKPAASALFVVNKSASVTMKIYKQNKLVQLNHEHDMIQTHQLQIWYSVY